MTHATYRIPLERVSYRGCRPAELLQFHVFPFLAEVFAPTNASRIDLPLRLVVKKTHAEQVWEVPFQNARLQPSLVHRHRRKLKTANVGKAIFQSDSFRFGIESCLLGWLGEQLSVSVIHFPPGWMDPRSEGGWRVEMHFANEPFAQWNGDYDSQKDRNLFVATGDPI